MKRRLIPFALVLIFLLQAAILPVAAAAPAGSYAQAFIERINRTVFPNLAYFSIEKPVILYDLCSDETPELVLVANDGSYAVKFQIFAYQNGETELIMEWSCGFASDPYDALYAMRDGTVGIFSSNSGGGGGEPQYNVHYGATYSPADDGTLGEVSSFRYEFHRNPDGSTDYISGMVNGSAASEAKVKEAEQTFTANQKVLLVDSRWNEPTSFAMSKNDALSYLNQINGQFSDVPSNAYYADAVAWAVANSITNGTSAQHFSPDATCTRAQVVTFLWRAQDCPEPTKTDHPFKDIRAGEYYYDAVLWAIENGITAGTGADTFGPDEGCTRGQVVTFLWRAAGKPLASSANPFKDVQPDAYYYDAVLWAVKNDVTAGTSATTFSPDATCTRGQIVTFLYRAKDVGAPPSPQKSWSEVYEDFVINSRFLNAGQEYRYDAGFFTAGLYDMDRDGIPELIISNGGFARLDRWAYIYTNSDGGVAYLGVGPSEAYYNPNDRVGIYGRFGMSSEETWTKYEKAELSVVTGSAGSFPAFSGHTDFIALPTRVTSQIKEAGWDAYLATQALP